MGLAFYTNKQNRRAAAKMAPCADIQLEFKRNVHRGFSGELCRNFVHG